MYHQFLIAIYTGNGQMFSDSVASYTSVSVNSGNKIKFSFAVNQLCGFYKAQTITTDLKLQLFSLNIASYTVANYAAIKFHNSITYIDN